MKPAMYVAMAFTLHPTTLHSFMRLPSSSMWPSPQESRSLKRPRPSPTVVLQPRQAEQGGLWEAPLLLELDVVEYQEKGEDALQLGSYIGNGKLQPLLTREESGPQLFFHDEEAQPVSVSNGSCRIVRVLDQVYVSQRIVEDRIKNPHGEEAEDCFLVEGPLNPLLVIKMERSEEG